MPWNSRGRAVEELQCPLSVARHDPFLEILQQCFLELALLMERDFSLLALMDVHQCAEHAHDSARVVPSRPARLRVPSVSSRPVAGYECQSRADGYRASPA